MDEKGYAPMRARTSEEAQRRLRVIDRYLAVPSPTAADDARFAGELGLSTDSLMRLARARRTMGQEENARPAQKEGAIASALRAATDPDLTNVSPSRRPLIRLRLAAIREHLSDPAATKEGAARHAAMCDLPSSTFARMVNLWIATREPSLLPGASEPLRRDRRKNPTVSPAADASVAAAIAKLGVGASSLAIHRESRRICETVGLKAPSKGTVYRRLMRARAEAPRDADGPDGLAIDHCALALAVSNGDGAQMPVLTFAFVRASGRILYHLLSLAPPTALLTARTVFGALRRSPSVGGGSPVIMSIPEEHGRAELLSTLRIHGVAATATSADGRRAGGSLAGQAFGDLLGGIRLRPRATLNPRDAALNRVMGSRAPLSMDEAETAVADAVALHNRGRAACGGFPVDEAERDGLSAALADLLRREGAATRRHDA